MKFFSVEKLSSQFNVLLFLIPGIYAFIEKRTAIAWVFVLIALVLELASIELFRPFFKGFSRSQSAYYKNGLIWLMWIALCLNTFTFDSFGWAWSRGEWFPFSPLVWLEAAFIIGLVGAVRVGNDPEKNVKDLSSQTARIWFWIIFVLAIVMRVYKMGTPEGSYGFDEAAGVMETRLVRDLHDYRQGYYIAYYQKPIFCYLTLFLWHWLPNATDIFIVRLAAVISDLGTIWILYLSGKELGGRRTGLFAAAIGAISKPLIILTCMGMGAVMVPFFTLLPILFVLRLFKKPDLSHFLQLGLALSLGIYNNDYIRIQMIFMIAAIFVWLLCKKENRTLSTKMGWLVAINGAALAFYCFYMSFGIAQSSWINRLFQDYQLWFFLGMLFCFLLLLIFTLVLGPKSPGVKKNKNWINAFLGLWVCVLLDYPMMTRADYWERLDNMVNRGGGALSESLINFISKVGSAGELIFWHGTWPPNMGMIGDSLFGFGEDAFIFLGLAFFLVKPNWPKAFIFLIAAVGILPHAVANGTHNARVADTIGPFILFGALGANEILQKAMNLSKKRGTAIAVVCLFVVFGAWSAWMNYERVFHTWFDQQTLYLTSARNIATHESALGNRVYFCDDIFCVESTVLNEGLLIHHLYPVNVIYSNPADKSQDISILVHDFSDEPGKFLKEQVQKYFPQVNWLNENEVQYCRIPAALLANGRQKMFELRDEPKSTWKREYILTEAGLIFDLLDYEDRAAHITDPVSPDYAKTYSDQVNQFVEAIRYSTTIHVAKESDYFLHYKAENRSSIQIDGKMVKDLFFFKLLDYWAPLKEGDEKIHLTPGDHRVEVVVAFQRSDKVPEFWLRPVGNAAPGTLLWSAFDF